MKFKDISQYTSIGNYEATMPLVYAVEWIEKQTKELNLQMNPDFQRGHVWTEDQQIKYIEYLLKGGKSARTFIYGGNINGILFNTRIFKRNRF